MTKKRTSSPMKKLIPAAGMLMISATMLATSTFAWFTMNKEVTVTGMQLKAQAEKGILINEKAGVSEGTWSEAALAGQSEAIALRPASTANFSAWWHANSKITSNEGGAGASGVDTDNTVKISDGVYYTDISDIATEVTAAVADVNAERTVYYTDGTGESMGYDNGEGYYVLYKYYIKSSANDSLSVTAKNLKATVAAEKKNVETENISTELDKALRVGIKVSGDSKTTIFAPISGHDATNKVAGSTAGTTYTDVTPAEADVATAINTAAVVLPAVTANGLEVDVYVWFEGEDTHCKSDNLTATLDSYQINITFTDADLGD